MKGEAWDRALLLAGLSKEDVRAALSLEYVVFLELDLRLNEEGDAQCPFHEDRRPSFAIFESGDGVERAGCWSCSWRGDVFDVLQLSGRSFGEALQRAKDLLIDHPNQATVRTARVRKTVTEEVLEEEIANARLRATEDDLPIKRVLTQRGFRMTPEFLIRRYDVGVASHVGAGAILVPHLDFYGMPTGYKIRAGGAPLIARGGSRFPYLYGSHLMTEDPRPIVLVEGESDVWTVDWTYPDDYHVLGLPTGAYSPMRAEWLELLTGQQVMLALDGDEAGQDATIRWLEALMPIAQPWVAQFAPGEDCSKVTAARLEEVLRG